MTNSISKPIDSFPYKELTPLPTTCDPTYHELSVLQKQLNANAMSVLTDLGGGTHGFLTLVVDRLTYFTIAQADFDPPTQPPVVPDLGMFGAMATNITLTLEMTRHKHALQEWNNYNATIKDLRSQLLVAVPRALIEELADKDSDFNNVPPLEIITKLFALYGKITPAMLKTNLAKLDEPWNPTDNINVLWKQIKDCKEFSIKGNEPIAESQICRTTVDNFLIQNAFPHAMETWLAKSDEDQLVYETLKTHFTKAYQILTAKTTTKSSGYAGAATNVDEPPTPDHAKAATQEQSKQPPADTNSRKPGGPIMLDVGRLKYCHTHGMNWTHSGKDCTKPATTHIATATINNMQGGNDKISRRKGEKRTHVPPTFPPRDSKKQKTDT